MSSTNFTLEKLNALEAAIAEGVLSVAYSDKKVEYRSLEEMLKIRDIMRKALGLISGKSGRIHLEHDKKLS